MALLYEKSGHIAKLGLKREKEKNALDPEILLDIHRAWEDINEDNEIRVAILYSALPNIFCSGMDLRTAIPVLTRAREPETEAEKWLITDSKGVGEAMLRYSFVKKPVIVAIHGYCLTGGFEMAMGADLRVASKDAVFQMREASLGIMPVGGANVFLPRLISPSRALEILLTADNYDAETLYEWGFLNRLVSRREDLMDASMELATKIASNGPLAVQGMIRLAREIRTKDMEYALNRELEIGTPIFGSEDAREGVRAQGEKPRPDFKGKL